MDRSPSGKKGRKRAYTTLGLCLLALAVAAVFLLRRVPATPPPKIIIAADTTIFTGPVKPDGIVDYVTALNKRNSQNITPGNNAFVALLSVFGTSAKALGPAHAHIVELAGGTESPGCWKPLPTDPNASRAESDRQYADYQSAQTRPWAPADQTELQAWLNSNQQAFALLAKAAEKEQFWFPLARSSPDNSLVKAEARGDFYYDLADAAGALRARAMRSISQGQPEQAWSDLCTAHRLAEMLGHDTTVIGILRGNAILENTLRTDVTLLGAAHNNQHLLADIQKTILALHPMPQVPEIFRREDRYCPLDAIEEMAAEVQRGWDAKLAGKKIAVYEKLTSQYTNTLPDWNAMLRFTNKFLDDYYSDPPAAPADRARHEKVVHDLWNQLNEAVRKDEPLKGDSYTERQWDESADAYAQRMTMHVLAVFLPDLSTTDDALARTRQRLRLVTLATAIQLYHADKGAYPPELSVLLPSYTAAVPTDQDGKPVRFAASPDGFELHSTGPYADDPDFLKRHKKVDIDIAVRNP